MTALATTMADSLAATALEHLPEAILMVHGDDIVMANPAACRLLDVRPGALVGREAPPWVPPLLTSQAGREVNLSRPGQRAIRLTVTVAPCGLQDGAPLQIVVLRDRTAQASREAELERRADRDGLTGLLNRRAFAQRLTEERKRLATAGRPLGLVAMDLDRFKGVNDEHGHPVGDRVLAEAAKRLASVARVIDTVARVGGEEFVWLLPDAGPDQLLLAAERLRERIAAEPFADGLRLTASIGFTSAEGDDDGEAIIRRADDALYWAKGAGRNAALGWSSAIAERVPRVRDAQTAGRGGLAQLAALADEADPAPDGRHGLRVASLAVALAAQQDWSPDQQALLHQAGRVHDVGKALVSDELLGRRGPLAPLEFAHVRRHADIGAALAMPVLLSEQVDWIRHHHTPWSAAPDVPAGAWLLAIADTWDAMTSDRCYRPALSSEAALEEVDRTSGTQLHPDAGRLLRAALAWWEKP